jgi:hypothetical protein
MIFVKKNKNATKIIIISNFLPRVKALPVPHGGRATDNQYFKSTE